MNERPHSTSDELYGELKAFVFERDRNFRNRESDVTTISHPPFNRRVGTLYSDDDESIHYDIFNTRTLALEASYNISDTERANKDTLIIFKLGLVAVTQLTELPVHLRNHLSDEQLRECGELKPGDLNQVQSFNYTVAHDALDDQTFIDHSGEYILCDNDNPLYQVRFPVDRHSYERVLVATEQRTLFVPPRIIEESADPHDQLLYDNDFRVITKDFTVRANTSATPEILSLHEISQQDDAYAIRALLKILRSSDPIPTFETLHNTIKKINSKQIDTN